MRDAWQVAVVVMENEEEEEEEEVEAKTEKKQKEDQKLRWHQNYAASTAPCFQRSLRPCA